MTQASPKGDRLVLWYRLNGGTYDVSAERRGDAPVSVRPASGKLGQTREQMLEFFFAQIKQDWVRRVYVDASSGIEREISERTVSRIKNNEFSVQDFLI
jgi:hypothetical protein